jgi:enterochelin esterase-like enzyme
LFEIIQQIPEENVDLLPRLYFDCGTGDGFLKANRELAELLKQKNIAFDYREVSGGHDWNYWDKQIRVVLEKTAEIFDRAKP